MNDCTYNALREHTALQAFNLLDYGSRLETAQVTTLDPVLSRCVPTSDGTL
jgi:hypothetical protein